MRTSHESPEFGLEVRRSIQLSYGRGRICLLSQVRGPFLPPLVEARNAIFAY
jgi:hypothetical protein